MYNEYFGFKESPFSIAPDPRYLFMTEQHRDALAHLVYGLNSEGGCILLTGEVGTGKTTICRCLLEQIPERSKVALVLNPKVSEIELLETICDELNIDYPDTDNTAKTYTDRIYKFLIESNRNNEKTVLIIDEAQNLDSKVLEQLRLLTNLETDQRKLLQIIILGQPELLDILAKNEMRQLAQRITARFHLQPLTRNEVKSYVDHRLAIAGQNIRLFPDDSTKLLYKLSKGVPRLINIICDRALLGAYVENQYSVNTRTMKKAAKEVFGELKNVEKHQKNKQWLYPLAAIASIAVISIAALFYFTYQQGNENSLIQSKIVSDIEESLALLNTEVIDRETGGGAVTHEDQTDLKLIGSDVVDSTGGTMAITSRPDSQIETTEASDAGYDDINTILNAATGNPVSAYQTLFLAWDKNYNTNTNITACKQAEKHGLSCLFKQGNLNNLTTHNRPAVLTLVNESGETRYITLTSINGDVATIYSDNNRHTVKLSDIDKHWFGKFTLLWKKPAHYSSLISPGDRGDIVNWLNIQVDKANNSLTDMAINTYDDTLMDKIKLFQSENGLSADGIVGPSTLIHLNYKSGISVPILSTQE